MKSVDSLFSVVDEIRKRCDIVEYISKYTRLRPKGKEYAGICPFHEDTKPSLSVSPFGQVFYCFGCGAGGDVIKFVERYYQVSYREAVKIIAEELGIYSDVFSDSDGEKESDINALRRSGYLVLEKAAEFYHNLLISNEGPLEYVVNRVNYGLAVEEKFGYCSGKGLMDILNEDEIDVALRLGLLKKTSKGKMYEFFENRIVFPIRDTKGRVIAFGGRVWDKSDVNTKAKYVNSPNSFLYTKEHHLYMMHRLNSKEDEIVVVEGYMDAITLHSYGIRNAVAVLGTALTQSQIFLLRTRTKRILLAFDGDKAGKVAVLRTIESVTKIAPEVEVKTVKLPKDEDPDSIVRSKGGRYFKQLCQESTPIAESFVETCISLLSSEEDGGTGSVTDDVDKAARIYQQIISRIASFNVPQSLRYQIEVIASKKLALPVWVGYAGIRGTRKRRQPYNQSNSTMFMINSTQPSAYSNMALSELDWYFVLACLFYFRDEATEIIQSAGNVSYPEWVQNIVDSVVNQNGDILSIPFVARAAIMYPIRRDDIASALMIMKGILKKYSLTNARLLKEKMAKCLMNHVKRSGFDNLK